MTHTSIASPTSALLDRAKTLAPTAVNSFEIAAVLEAEGLRDSDAQQAGWPDLFTFAEHCFARQQQSRGAESPEPTQRTNPVSEAHLKRPGRKQSARLLLRGILFTLPGLAVAGLVPMPPTANEAKWLILTLVVAWALGQGFAYVGYMMMSMNPSSAAQTLRNRVLAATALFGLGLAGAAALGEIRSIVAWAAFAQGVYLLAASNIMVMGKEILLFPLLLPGVLVGTLRIINRDGQDPYLWETLVSSASLVGSVAVLAVVSGRLIRAESKAPPASAIDRTQLFFHTSNGLMTASLVLWLPWRGLTSPGAMTMMVFLVLSLGVAEWLLVWLRAEGRRHLGESGSVFDFRKRARRSFMIASTLYGVTLTSLFALAIIAMQLSESDWTAHNGAALGGLAIPFEGLLGLGFYLLYAGITVTLFGVRAVLLMGAGSLVALSLGPPHTLAVSESTWAALVYTALAVVAYATAQRRFLAPAHHR